MNEFDEERYNQLKMFNKEYHILNLPNDKNSMTITSFIKKNMPEMHEKIEYAFYNAKLDLD